VRALDDDHVLMTVARSPDALVLDVRTRSWCSATLPAVAAEALGDEDDFPVRTSASAHKGSLFLWRRAVQYESDYLGPGGPRIIDVPAIQQVVTFAWE
jgi:hypothetical protein